MYIVYLPALASHWASGDIHVLQVAAARLEQHGRTPRQLKGDNQDVFWFALFLCLHRVG